MADKKITDLPTLSVADDSDLFAIVDVSGNITKKVTRAGLVPDGSVTATKIAVLPSFAATRSAAFNLTAATSRELIFDNEVYDTTSSFDGTVFTAPIAGIYHFTVTIDVESNASSTRAFATVSATGTTSIVQQRWDGDASRIRKTLAVFEGFMDVGATLRFNGWNSHTVNIAGPGTSVSGHYVTRAS